MPRIADSPDIAAPPLAPQDEPWAGRFRHEIVERPDSSWDGLAAGFADMCMEQTFAFAGARWSKLHPVGLILREELSAEPVAMALVLLAILPVLGIGIAYVKFGPLWRRKNKPADPDILLGVLDALKREFGQKRRLVVRVLPPADPDHDWNETMKRANFSFHAALSDRERYLVDLSLPEEEQLASLGAQWRANLKKASNELVIEEPDLKAGIPAFVSLYRDMLARKRFVDHHGVGDIAAIAERAGKTLGMRLFLASHRGEPVVGSVVIGAGDRVFVPFSATNDAALGLRAGYALRWAIVNRLRGTGARWLDLGGAEGDSGLRHFKLGNVGKRGRVVDIPGEYDFAPNALSAAAARAIEFGRDLVRTPSLKKLVAFLPV